VLETVNVKNFKEKYLGKLLFGKLVEIAIKCSFIKVFELQVRCIYHASPSSSLIAFEFFLQMDGAGGHGVGKAKDKGESRGIEFAAYLNDLWRRDPRTKQRRDVTITVIVQPSKSPDLNFLDIGVWHSLAAGFEVVRVAKESVPKALEHRIIDAFEKRWNEWDSERHMPGIMSAYRTTLQQIIDHDGGNDFKIERTCKSHLFSSLAYLTVYCASDIVGPVAVVRAGAVEQDVRAVVLTARCSKAAASRWYRETIILFFFVFIGIIIVVIVVVLVIFVKSIPSREFVWQSNDGLRVAS